MAKDKTAYVCSSCGYDSPKWIGKCPACGEWNTFQEVKLGKKTTSAVASEFRLDVKSSPISMSKIETEEEPRINMGDGELNRVLGGGLVPGSMTLLGGEPGIGKSTLILQTVMRLKGMKVLYVSGEESARQLKLRADRINLNPNPNLDPNLDLNCKSSTLKRLQGFLSSQGGFVVDRFYEDKVLDFAMEFVVHKDHTVEFLGYSVFQTGESGAYGYNYVESQEELLRRIDVDAALLHRLIAYHKEHLAQTAYHGPVGIDMLKTADGSIHPCLEINFRMNMGILALLLHEQYGSGATVALTPVREHGFQALVEDGRLMILSEK